MSDLLEMVAYSQSRMMSILVLLPHNLQNQQKHFMGLVQRFYAVFILNHSNVYMQTFLLNRLKSFLYIFI